MAKIPRETQEGISEPQKRGASPSEARDIKAESRDILRKIRMEGKTGPVDDFPGWLDMFGVPQVPNDTGFTVQHVDQARGAPLIEFYHDGQLVWAGTEERLIHLMEQDMISRNPELAPERKDKKPERKDKKPDFGRLTERSD